MSNFCCLGNTEIHKATKGKVGQSRELVAATISFIIITLAISTTTFILATVTTVFVMALVIILFIAIVATVSVLAFTVIFLVRAITIVVLAIITVVIIIAAVIIVAVIIVAIVIVITALVAFSATIVAVRIFLVTSANSNVFPCLSHCLASLEICFSHIDGHVCKLQKCASSWDSARIHGLPPDLASFLPSVATKGSGDQVECFIRDTRINVDATIVFEHFLEILHIRNLGVFALQRAVSTEPAMRQRDSPLTKRGSS